MPDETLKLQDELRKKAGGMYQFISKPVYNIDDMDNAAFMLDHEMEGVYVLGCAADVDPDHPGKVYVDDVDAGAPVLSYSPWGGCSLGFKVRRFIREYGKTYTIRYEGGMSVEGEPLPPYTFQLESLPKVEIGAVYPEHDELVLQSAREGMVLLKNDHHALPLGQGAVINTFGKAAVYAPLRSVLGASHRDAGPEAAAEMPLVVAQRRKTARTFRCQGGSASQSARYGACPRIEVRRSVPKGGVSSLFDVIQK